MLCEQWSPLLEVDGKGCLRHHTQQSDLTVTTWSQKNDIYYNCFIRTLLYARDPHRTDSAMIPTNGFIDETHWSEVVFRRNVIDLCELIRVTERCYPSPRVNLTSRRKGTNRKLPPPSACVNELHSSIGWYCLKEFDVTYTMWAVAIG